MRTQRIGLAALLLGLMASPIGANLGALPGVSQVLAQVPDPQPQADQLFQQGVEKYQADQIAAAIQLWQQALKLYEQQQDSKAQSVTLKNLSTALLSEEQYEQAIAYLQKFLQVAKTLDEHPNTQQALSYLGLAHHRLRQYEPAIQYYQQSLELAQDLGDRRAEGVVLGYLGDVYQELHQYPKVVEFYEQYLTIARQLGSRQAEGIALANLGIAYRALGNYAEAIARNQAALAIMQELKNRQAEGQVLGNLANAYEAIGNYDKTLEYHQQSLEIAQEIGDRQGETAALGNLGAIHTRLGDYQQAVEFYQQSLEIAQKVGDRQGEGYSLNNLGSAYHAQRDLQAAIQHYQQSLAIARQVNDSHLEAEVLGNLGLAYEHLQNYDQALQSHTQSLAIAQKMGARRAEALALNNLAHTLLTAGKPQEAEPHLRQALEVLDALRSDLDDIDKVSLFDTQVLTYNLLQQVLIAQDKIEAALEIAEWGRARAFVERIAQSLQRSHSTKPSLDVTTVPPPTIDQIRQIARTRRATLVEYSIVPDDEFIAQGKLRGLESELLIWVVQPNGNVTLRRVDLKPLQTENPGFMSLITESQATITQGRGREQSGLFAQLVQTNQATLGTRNKFAFNTAAADEVIGPLPDPEAESDPSNQPHLQQLHKLLIEPIADLLPSDPQEHVVFIPQEALFLVPFPALQNSEGEYLIEKHTILSAPAIQVLELTYQQRQQQQPNSFLSNALIVGNPTMPAIALSPDQPPQQLLPLPGAEAEAIAIAKMLNTQAILGDQATKQAIAQKMTQARLIHLATHGLLDDFGDQGIPGAIALAPSGNDDGFLTASEILNLQLQAELVVLSACDTGRGQITGDGVVGLSRSLIAAGTPSVIVSLWAVPDAPTSDLMTEFYRQLQQQPDKAQALRQAMLSTMQNHPNPRNWAAFTLIGEAK